MLRTKTHTFVPPCNYPINTLVRITASGGQTRDWWQRVALSGATQDWGGYHHTIIQVLHPDTCELTQLPWRTEWLQVLPDGEQQEEVEALKYAIALFNSDSGIAASVDSHSDEKAQDSNISSLDANLSQPILTDSLPELDHGFGDPPSSHPTDTPLVSVQWDGVQSQAVQQAGELHMESDRQATDDTLAQVDQVPIVPEVVDEELTEEEAEDRHRLELTVERAFYEAGCALRELRDRRLYRSTHPDDFEGYCRARFGKTKQAVNYLIAAASIYDNLTTTNRCLDNDSQSPSNCCRDSEKQTTTNCCRILPTNEYQVRPLSALEPEEQREVWQQAVEAAGDKVPSGRIVKEIVSRFKERNATPPPIHYCSGDVVEIRAGCNPTLRKHDGLWGIVTHVGSFSCTVHISVRNVNVQCKPSEIDRVDPKYTQEILAVSKRITALMQRDDLSRTAIAVVETLVRQTCFSSDDLWLLEKLEERYGIE